MTDIAELISRLNPEQQQAVESTEGALLVLAGAGTGKTRVLTTRLAHILQQGKAKPWEILAVTFTNKAAAEMRSRIQELSGEQALQVWLGTFHSLSLRILRRHAEAVGLESSFSILDTDDQLRLIKQITTAENLDEKRYPPRLFASIISRWKDKAFTPYKVPSGAASSETGALALKIYKQYQERLLTLNACDFGDLLLHCLTLFGQHPDVLAQYQRQFRYVLVDEYQDTNVAQYLWLRLLAMGSGNICCVGDDDQSIYGWRGAEVENILQFEKNFTGGKVIRLELNYRSTPHILGAASGLIAHNEGRLGKTLWTESDKGEKVTIQPVDDGQEEARTISEHIEEQNDAGVPLNQMAILVRAGHQTRAFEERLAAIGIPYRIVGGLRFYERAEVRDAIAYFRLLVQPRDDLAFERIINVPKRGLGAASLQQLQSLAQEKETGLLAALVPASHDRDFRPAARQTFTMLAQQFSHWRTLAASNMPPNELAEIVLDESGYTAMLKADKSPEAVGRLENLKELVAALKDFSTLAGFLEHVGLVLEMASDDTAEKVTLMTLHAAKGLEFDSVFLPGWEEGIFPNNRAIEETGQAGLEEERRLAYVGLTRARKRAMITFARSRRLYNQWQYLAPSRFLKELPPEHVQRLDRSSYAEERLGVLSYQLHQ